ncbi:MAG: hypothetical protein ACRDJC_08135, partial [Thermomicrobiales bacterium]
MSQVLARDSIRANSRYLAFVAALAIALVGVFSSDTPVGAVANCAAGGNLADGGTLSVGCAFGGDAGTTIASTIDVSDPALTVAGSYGGDDGYPAGNASGVVDLG